MAVEPVTPRATEAVRSRFSRTLSIYDDTDTRNAISQVSNGKEEEPEPEYKKNKLILRIKCT